jgi:hypothetical protein
MEGGMTRDPLALAMLALEVGPLVRDLDDWHFVGALAETVLGAARGHDALGAADVAQLRRWAHRWRKLHPDLRRFYADHAQQHEAASVALWHVLEGRPHDLRPATLGQVHQLHDAWASAPAPYTLFPRLP